MSKAPNRCHYEVIGLPITCTQDEIRSAYKKLALRRHPDKLVQSGAISSAEATAAFQELAHAYEVLSDPKERHWYDSHRTRILFSDHSGSDASSPAGIPNLFSYFSRSCYTDYTDPKKGFYKVYSDVFDKIFANEIKHAKALGLRLGSVKEAPLMGDLKSLYTQVNAFYGYWLGFRSVMEFGWVYKWRDASAGTNRKLRRMMEEDNKKLRKKAVREFNEIVRGLAEFVKKRDKRVIDMMVMKEKEREKKREEDMERRKKMERKKLEKANMYKEPEWAHVQEDEIHDIEEDEEEEEVEERKEWFCAACRKKFKSDKQWRNHEQSKKHKEKVAELKASFTEEDENFENVERDEVDGEEFVQQNEVFESNVADGSFRSAEDHVSDLEEAFKDGVSIQEEENGGELSPGTDDNDVEEPYKEEKQFKQEMSIQEEESGGELLLGTEDSNNVGEPKREEKQSIKRDDETSILKAMISGHKMKKHGTVKKQPKAPSARKVHIDSENKEEIVMEYSNRKKGSRKSRRAKGVKAKNSQESALEANVDHANSLNEENGMQNNVEAHSGGIKSEENLEDNVNCKGSKSNRFNKAKKSSRSTKQKKNSSPSVEEVCGGCN